MALHYQRAPGTRGMRKTAILTCPNGLGDVAILIVYIPIVVNYMIISIVLSEVFVGFLVLSQLVVPSFGWIYVHAQSYCRSCQFQSITGLGGITMYNITRLWTWKHKAANGRDEPQTPGTQKTDPTNHGISNFRVMSIIEDLFQVL